MAVNPRHTPRPASTGTVARHGPESWPAMLRNWWPAWTGIRNQIPTDRSRTSPLQNTEWLIGDGCGSIHVGRVGPIDCVASAADEDICYAMLARRDGETLLQLLHRLDKSIAIASETSETIDEINGP